MAGKDGKQTPGAGENGGGAARRSKARAALPAHLKRRPSGWPDLSDPEVQAWMAQRRADTLAARKARVTPAPPAPALAGVTRVAMARRAARSGQLAAAIERAARFRWTTRHQLSFLAALAETGNVACAAARVGCREQAAYRLRRVDAVFAAEWEAAELSWRSRLTGSLREAAGKGYATVAANGGFGKRPVVSERAAMFLAHGLSPTGQPLGEAASAAPGVSGLDGEAEQAALEAKLQELAERLGSPFAPAGGDGVGSGGAADGPAGDAGDDAGSGPRP